MGRLAGELVSDGEAMQETVMSKICILTPDPDYEENWQPMADQFRAVFGNALAFRPWTQAAAPGADPLGIFDLVLPLLAWGYQRQPATWYHALDTWEAQGVRFANIVPLLRWNTDKDYLFTLAAKGVQIVPTVLVDALSADTLADARARLGTGRVVIKPAISGGADGTYVLGLQDPIPFDVLERSMLIQPMMPAIVDEGEYSLFYFGGTLSHAILKKPAAGDFRVQEQFGGRETAVDAPAPARHLAEAALAAAPFAPLYARVDMVRDAAGHFCLMELELIEPALFLSFAADAGQAFAKAVTNALTA